MRRLVIQNIEEDQLMVTRKKPVVVYVRRGLKVLENHKAVTVKGVGPTVQTAVFVAQDITSGYKRKLKTSCEVGTLSSLIDINNFETGQFGCEEKLSSSISITLEIE